jgi:hypothetical protein
MKTSIINLTEIRFFVVVVRLIIFFYVRHGYFTDLGYYMDFITYRIRTFWPKTIQTNYSGFDIAGRRSSDKYESRFRLFYNSHYNEID